MHRSAYGKILIPIVQIKNDDGPTVCLMAGNHGDEYEAQIALTKLCRDLQTSDIRGRLIIITMANFPAADAGLRTSPIDGGNLNRLFPGDAHGSPSEMIAHYYEEELIPMCDYFFDFHSGGSSLFYPPTFLRGLGHSANESQMLKNLQAAFDAPYAWVFTSGGGRKSTARTAMGAAGRKGAITVMAELGGGGAVSRDILAITERGINAMLHIVGMLLDYVHTPSKGTRELTIVESIASETRGIFEPYVDVETEVIKGAAAGAIHFSETPWKAAEILRFTSSGMVLCKRVPGRVERGDCLFQIGQDLPDKYRE